MSNELRTAMTRAAILHAESAGEDITPENLAKYLPPDFAIDAEDIADTGYEPPVARPVEHMNGSSKPMPTEVTESAPVFSAQGAPSITVAEAKQLLDEARVGVRVLSDKLRIARGRLADCLQRYMASRGAAAPTPDELRRDFCRQETENRKAKASGLVSPRQPTHGNSKLDRSLYYQGKQAGDVDDFGAVSGTGHRRGAFPASQRGRRLRPATV
jgi:hypothetical protein